MVSGVFSLPFDPYNATESSAGSAGNSRLREFVCGAENRLLEVLEHFDDRAAAPWDLLVLYGPAQVGKSHLALGLSQRYEQRPGAGRTIYVTGADFARQYAAAVDTDAVAEFRSRYRRARLVVIDDLNLLAGKTAAQEELARTLDALAARENRAVITWRGTRFDASELEPALASRLRSALVLPLHLPALATRREMVRRLALARGLALEEGLVAGLAAAEPTTFPDLAARLAKVAVLGATPADPAVMQELLGHSAAPRALEVKTILTMVARHFHLRQAELRGAGRSRSLVLARGVALHLSRKLTGLSLEKIGREFGGRDHTTVLHACSRLESLLKHDAALRAEVDELRRLLEHRSSTVALPVVEKRSTRRRSRSADG